MVCTNSIYDYNKVTILLLIFNTYTGKLMGISDTSSQSSEGAPAIILPKEALNMANSNEVTVTFNTFQSGALFPMSSDSPYSSRYSVVSNVVGATVEGAIVQGLRNPVTITLSFMVQVKPTILALLPHIMHNNGNEQVAIMYFYILHRTHAYIS